MRRFVVPAAMLLLIVSAGAASAVPTTESFAPRARSADASDYWTADRMRRAEPPHLMASSGALTKQRAARMGVPGGYSPSAAPSGIALPTRSLDISRGVGTEYFWPPESYGQQPAINLGKLFFRWNGGNYVCSATIVNSPNRSLVWTAGHCVANNGRWSKIMMFCPAYIDGDCPYGEWEVRKQYTTWDWFNKGNFSYDLAAMRMSRLGGQRIADAFGGQGIAWNRPRLQDWTALGYPAAPPFDGERLYACEDTSSGLNNPPRPGPHQTVIDCTMTGGSSGGGWLISIADGLGYVGGLTSLGDAAHTVLSSPYHGREARRLWRLAGS